jgi:hypothetical protein
MNLRREKKRGCAGDISTVGCKWEFTIFRNSHPFSRARKKTGEWPSHATFDVGGVQSGFETHGKPEIFVDDVDKAYLDLKEKGVKFVTKDRSINLIWHDPLEKIY